MSDLIDRKMAIDLINQHTFYDDYDDTDKSSLIDGLQSLPSAQPDIVQCCKCVHWQQDTVRQNSNDVSWWNEAVCDKYSDDIWTAWKDADWYCADAERRTDE